VNKRCANSLNLFVHFNRKIVLLISPFVRYRTLPDELNLHLYHVFLARTFTFVDIAMAWRSAL